MTIRIDAGNGGLYELDHAVFDVNGTLSCDGQLVDGVIERMHALRQLVQVHLLTADTYGTQRPLIDVQLAIAREPKIESTVIGPKDGPEDRFKEAYVTRLGEARVAAIGNGRNDKLMLQKARLGIAVSGPEGAASETVSAATLLARDPLTALDLLLHPLRLRASLRF